MSLLSPVGLRHKLAVVMMPLVFLAAWRLVNAGGNTPALELRPGDHISILGNTLADRMQHYGWLETLFHNRFPNHKLSFRNLGFSGDELTVRFRSANFGSPDDWLTKTKADVVLGFFGYNESFAGDQGLEKFKSDLQTFIKNTLNQKYNGQSPPRLVLFSPIAHEDLKDRNLSDGSENNQRLAKYTAAMAEVARANRVPFVDLFHPTQNAYAKSKQPLTINGVHLNGLGNQQVARIIDQALFGQVTQADPAHLEKIREAVLDANHHWFNRYRTVDGYSIFGGRAALKFVAGQTNKEVMQREMEILDAMTANRDQRIWAVAKGGDAKVDDSNLPDFIPVVSNKPGKGSDGKHLFLDGEEAIEKMTIAKGLKVNLFASEKEFPDLANPVQMQFDPAGRLWVAVWPTYPHWKPGEPMNDKILIFEDTNGDGKADKQTIFADGLHCPTGMELWGKGVLVAQQPDLFYLEDTDGDGKADRRIRVLCGLDSADTHHAANSFVLDPGGALYFQEGTFHHTQVETPYGPPVRNANAGVFRYEPRTQKFEVYVNFGFANPHGHVFDRWGQDIVVDGTGANPYHATLFSGQTEPGQRHARPPGVYKQKTRPCPGLEILSSKHFPEAWQGNLLVGNVIGFQGILQYKLNDKGASLAGTEVEPILSSSDPNFRPSDLRIGPDGALYFLDWHNPIIGHMQHNLRDPSRDREHGRIYRVTHEGRPLSKPAKIAGEPIPKLLDLLKDPEDRVRYRTRIELGSRDSAQVLAAAKKWMEGLDRKDPEYEHHVLEALWLHQNHNVVDEALLRRVLRSPDFRARAAATRVLCYWRDRVKEPLELLRLQINDPHPRVRLEAIRALSFFHGEAPLSVAIEMLAHPDDEYLRYTFNETLNTLERRLGTGGKLDRKNIASSLVAMLEKGTVAKERQPALIETICRHGGPKDLQVIWQQVQGKAYSPELRRNILDWLSEAATARNAKPPVDPAAVVKLLTESAAAKDVILIDALDLAAAWKVKEASSTIRKLALNQEPLGVRLAAIDALARLNDPENHQDLVTLTDASFPMPVRLRASIGLAQVNLKQGASAAAKALADVMPQDDLNPLVEAFLIRKNGPASLADALSQNKINPDTGKRILRAMFLAGNNDATLSAIAGKLAGLDAAPKVPTAQELRQLAGEVAAKGDPAKGEQVFRRADLGCLKCHAISKAGGHIGPDLGPIGRDNPIDYILQSLLDPNVAIKEEYITKTIVTASGQVVNGVVVERNKNQVILKDATGKLIRLQVADIEEEAAGKSLMPEGVTRILTRDELINLARFISELGKPGPYGLRTAHTIQRWKNLRDLPSSLKEGIPNRELVRDLLLNGRPEAWELVFSKVNGTLPLDELAKPGVHYLQAEIDVTQPGPVEILVDATSPVTFWVDEESFEKQNRAVVELTPGRHRLTMRVTNGTSAPDTLRVEVRKPSDSRVGFEVVQGE